MKFLILNDIRSLYNVGSIFRVADGAGIDKLYITGKTGYPRQEHDERKPWEIENIEKKLSKTALGAHNTVPWEYIPKIADVLNQLREQHVQIIALELHTDARNIFEFTFPDNAAILLGNEVDGVPADLMSFCDEIVQIPMKGQKESLNVSTAAAIASYQLTS